MDQAAIAATVEWLLDGARSAVAPEAVLDELCRRLVAAGLPLFRAAVFVRTLHPNVRGRRVLWRADAGVTIDAAAYEVFDSVEFHGSPVDRVYRTAEPVRLRLLDPAVPIDHEFPLVLRGEGVTDYLATPLIFTDGEIQVLSLATCVPDGFTDAQLAGVAAIVNPLARVAEIRALRRTAVNLLDTYVGKRSGARILAGHIRRGDVETIEAAFWYSDLRDFTALNESLPPADIIALLNQYFGAVTDAVEPRGGEVLQFIGDAALVVFPVGAEGRRGACGAALAAGRAALAAIDAVNRDRGRDGQPALRFGIGLHVGAVSWGNVGGGDRLGLNVIGPAINRTARIETLTKEVGLPLLMSQDFADALDEPCRAVGRFALKGVPEPQTIYAPGEPQPS